MAAALLKPTFPRLSRGRALARDLIAAWPVYEGSGATVNDLSGQGNQGTLHNSAKFVGSPQGWALSFTGSSSQYMSTAVNYGSAASVVTFSVSLWFRSTDTGGHCIFGMNASQDGTSGTFDRLMYIGTDGKLYFGVFNSQNTTSINVGSSGTVADGKMHHAVGVCDSANQVVSLYLDGISQGTTAFPGGAQAPFTGYSSSYWVCPMAALTNILDIWPATTGAAGYYVGLVTDMRVYNDRALTAQDMREIYMGQA
jgi:hypothetical protein